MGLQSKLKKNETIYLLGIKWVELCDKWKVQKLKKYTMEQRKAYIADLYEKRVGKPLDWNHLTNYTEKMQWVKLNDATDIKAKLADKYAVRSWVKKKIGGEYLIPLLGVWNSYDEIDFSKLPKRFVLKVNNGSGTNIIVKNKAKLNHKIARARIHNWMAVDRSYLKGFEMHYAKIRPCIIAEQFIEYDGDDLPDYKFLCFGGKVYYCWVDVGRYHEHKRNVYDLDWNLQPWNQFNYGNADQPIPKPECFDEMVRLAGILCQGFSHVRVDFYEVNGKVYFGEMTFTNGSGFEPIIPERYNKMLGDLWELSRK